MSSDLSAILAEARGVLSDKDTTKSQSSLTLARLVVRLIETLHLGRVETQIPPKNWHPEDERQPAAPVESRRF